MEKVDICIIGGGMAGASVAYRLARSASVLLLEREPYVGYHSTGRSAALFHPQYGSPVIRALTRASSAFMHAPPAAFGTVLSERGAIVLGRPDQQAALAHHEQVAAASGQTLNRLGPAEVVEKVPSLRREAVGWGLYDPLSMDMDVEALLQGYLREARQHGLKVVTSADISAIRRADGRWQVLAPTIEVSAEVVVNAAGAWADEVARLAGVAPLGLVPHRRTAFTFDPPEGVSAARWPMVADAEEQFYFKPDAGRVLGSLAEEVATAPADVQPDDLDVAIAVDRIEGALDFPIRRVVRAWAGLRTFGPDRNPVSGFEPRTPGFYWHAGLGGYGIQTSAALSAFAAGQIVGAPHEGELADGSVGLAQLGPERLRR
jgi:D-arginine dehydrogenase